MSSGFPSLLYHFTPTTTMYESSSCSISLSTVGTISLLNFAYSTGCAVVCHCGFNLHLLLASDTGFSSCTYVLHVLMTIHIFSFMKCQFKCCPLLNWVIIIELVKSIIYSGYKCVSHMYVEVYMYYIFS